MRSKLATAREGQGSSCVDCVLDTSEYFQNLGAKARDALRAVLESRAFDRRAGLYREGDPSTYLYLLRSGEVKLYRSLPDGRQQIHKIANLQGDLIGCEDLFHSSHRSSAEAITNVRLCCLRQRDLQRLTVKFPEIAETLMRTMSQHLNAYIHHISDLGQKNGIERVASYLLFLHDAHDKRKLGDVLRQSLTRMELAEMLGITQRTLIRCLKKLESEGVISLLSEGGIAIRALDTLTQIGSGY